jgi:hypothetical protein
MTKNDPNQPRLICQIGWGDQDNSIESKSKKNYKSRIPNQLNVEGLNWKKIN